NGHGRSSRMKVAPYPQPLPRARERGVRFSCSPPPRAGDDVGEADIRVAQRLGVGASTDAGGGQPAECAMELWGRYAQAPDGARPGSSRGSWPTETARVLMANASTAANSAAPTPAMKTGGYPPNSS